MNDTPTNVYAGFAGVYDRLMSDVPYGEWAHLIDSLIRKYGVSRPETADCGRSDASRNTAAQDSDSGDAALGEDPLLAQERNLVVDLGCGTGTMTGLLADMGYDMMGIDVSPDMLVIAGEKNAGRETPIPYICQDMRDLDLYCTAGTIVSVCDSINYITRASDLLKVFRLVNRFLYPGGLFLFDFHTKHYYRDVLGTRMIGETGEEISYLWDNAWSEKKSLNRCELTIFAGEAGGSYARVDETHIQRGFLLSEMKQIIEKAGMRFVTALDMDTGKKPHARSGRILAAARESGKMPCIGDR